MKRDYKFGEYYSPLDIVKIAKKKLKSMKWSVLLLPISAIFFLFNIITSIMLYPIFILNKIFFDFKARHVKTKSLIFLIIWLFADFLHDVLYALYWFFMPINRLFAVAYMVFPKRVIYLSNQTVIIPNRIVKEFKKVFRTKTQKYKDEKAENFELDFFMFFNSIIADAKKEVDDSQD